MTLLIALLSMFLHQGLPQQAPTPAALVPLPPNGKQAAWSSDSSEIAVPAPHSITVLDSAGHVKARIGGISPLEPFTESCFASLSWPRPGTVLFVGPDSGDNEGCVVGEAGANGRDATRTRPLGAVEGADWSESGWPLTYVRDDRSGAADKSSLWQLMQLGGRPRRITSRQGEISQATVSADGSATAYVLRRGSDPWQSIWEVTGRNTHKIAGNLLVSWMDWSPDHRRLAVIGVPRAGSRHNQLLLFGSNRDRRVLVSKDIAAGAGSWSPDGEAVTYATESGKIRSVALQTGESDDITQLNGRTASSLLWAPNGKVLAFTAQRVDESD